MVIEKLNIQSFGMLTSRSFELGEGINLIEGENESGKSTVSAFIRFMLYGLDKKSAGEKLSERQRYINWKSGEASGSMILFCAGKRYKIERSVRLTSVSESGRENYRESLSVIDTDTGMKVHEGEVPGEVFLGVTKDVFENTAYIKQLGISGVDANLVGEAIQNILFSADESVNTGRAEDKLDLCRRAILHKNEKGGALYELEREKDNVDRELLRAMEISSAQIAKEAEHADCVALMEESSARLSLLASQKEAHGILEAMRRFESLHALEDKVKGLEKEYNDFIRENTVEGFFPDREYVSALTSCEREIIAKRGELLSREGEYTRLKTNTRQDARLSDIYAEIREAGGEEAVKSAYEMLAAGKKTLSMFSGVFAALAALTLVSGVAVLALFSAFRGLGIVLTVSGVLLLCAFFGMLHSKNKAAKGMEKYLSRFGVGEGETLDSVIKRAKENEEEAKRLFEVVSIAEGELVRARAELDDLLAKRTELASRYGGAELDINILIERAEHALKRGEELLLEKEKYSIPMMSAKSELSAYNEAELGRRFGELNVPDADKINMDMLLREADFLQKKLETLNFKKIEIEKQLIALGANAANPTVLSARSEEMGERIAEMKRDHAAYKLAIEAIGEASERLRAGVTPRLSASAKGYMSSLTGGKYSEGGFAGADGEFAISFECDGEHRRLESLSAGTQDAAYISLRLALADLLYKIGSPALVLDESFAYLDDVRTKNMLSVLEGSGKQSLIFSCRDRERTLLSGKEYNYIKL